MQDGEIKKLIDKYLNGTATETEAKQVDDWYASFESEQGIANQLNEDEIGELATKSFQAVLASLKQNV